jgi:NAD(P)-dependent dehydrogenase (short-subunit alcohol dehydrogenase family)
VVDAILYLERSVFVTGETLHVDGGRAAGHATCGYTLASRGGWTSS